MIRKLSIEEIKKLKRKEDINLPIGLLIMVIGTSLTALILSYLLKRDDLVWLMVVPALGGLIVILTGLGVYQCERCGEYYTSLPHPEEECLKELKAKLEKV